MTENKEVPKYGDEMLYPPKGLHGSLETPKGSNKERLVDDTGVKDGKSVYVL